MSSPTKAETTEATQEQTTTEETQVETRADAESTPEPTEAAAAEGTDDEATEVQGEAEAADDEPAEEKRRRQGGYQRKLERERRENELLRAQLQALQQLAPAKPAKDATPEEKFAEHVDSLVEQRLAAKEAQRQQQETLTAFQRRTAEFRSKVPDFDEVVAEAWSDPLPQVVSEAILTSEHAPEIMDSIGRNPAELARFRALPPVQAIREIGRLEAKWASATATPTKTAPKPVARKPSAPAPITPVTARGPSTLKSPDDMSFDEYSRWRESQKKR